MGTKGRGFGQLASLAPCAAAGVGIIHLFSILTRSQVRVAQVAVVGQFDGLVDSAAQSDRYSMVYGLPCSRLVVSCTPKCKQTNTSVTSASSR